MLLGFAVVFTAINSLFLLAAKGEYVKQALVYHLKKPAEAADKQAIFFRIVKTNALLFILGTVAVVSRNRTKLYLIVPAFIAAAYMAAFPLLKTSFNY